MTENDAAHRNNLHDLIEYFSVPDNPVRPSEFRKFWLSLSFDEMIEYMNADLHEKKSEERR